jgi:hypothetical protein
MFTLKIKDYVTFPFDLATHGSRLIRVKGLGK